VAQEDQQRSLARADLRYETSRLIADVGEARPQRIEAQRRGRD